jgi:hypothetical protein
MSHSELHHNRTPVSNPKWRFNHRGQITGDDILYFHISAERLFFSWIQVV